MLREKKYKSCVLTQVEALMKQSYVVPAHSLMTDMFKNFVKEKKEDVRHKPC